MADMTPAPETELIVNGVRFEHHEIESVVRDFYSRVQKDPILSEPFRSVQNWPQHLQRLTHFWWIRFGGKPYLQTNYNPVLKHFQSGFNRDLLARWLSIFQQTLQDHLQADQIALWSTATQMMGQGMAAKNEALIQHFQNNR